jgi:hypothetical protein
LLPKIPERTLIETDRLLKHFINTLNLIDMLRSATRYFLSFLFIVSILFSSCNSDMPVPQTESEQLQHPVNLKPKAIQNDVENDGSGGDDQEEPTKPKSTI